MCIGTIWKTLKTPGPSPGSLNWSGVRAEHQDFKSPRCSSVWPQLRHCYRLMDINWKMWSRAWSWPWLHEKLSFPPQAKWEMKNQVCTFVIRLNAMTWKIVLTVHSMMLIKMSRDSYILNSSLLFQKKPLPYFICLHNFLNGATCIPNGWKVYWDTLTGFFEARWIVLNRFSHSS